MLGEVSSISRDPFKAFYASKTPGNEKSDDSMKKGDSWLLLLIVECHDAEVHVQSGKVENTCLVPLWCPW